MSARSGEITIVTMGISYLPVLQKATARTPSINNCWKLIAQTLPEGRCGL